ncbi:TPA: hypothetical protein JLQ40_004727 [Escherichia coli]|nr:hypothetical protein [Escherichia coli]
MVASHRILLHTRAGIGLAKSINQYRLTPGFGGFTPVPHVTTACRLTCRWRDIFSVYYYAILFIRLTVL